MIKPVCIALLFSLSISLATHGQTASILTPTDFQDQVSHPGIQILDVRTSSEYNSGHIKNALQADWLNREEFEERTQYLDKEKPLYIYCGSGVRSNDARKWLQKQGFQNIFELQMGFIKWKSENKPIEAEKAISQMTENDYRAITAVSGFVLVDFGATWCPPCRKMEPVLEQLYTDLPNKFALKKIDAGIHTTVMAALKVEKLPTFILYQNGKEVWRKEGLVSLQEFKSHIQ